jgi:ABC-type Fe3+-hydroxamate transport system substrate-binding protein
MSRKVYCESLEIELELPDKCERIISFSPAVTEALFVMGLGDKIIGVSAFCVRPEQARKKPILGSYSSVNIERLSSFKPDLIFTTTGYQRDFAKKLSKLFNVYAIALPTNIAGIISTCTEVGIVAGYYDEARNLEKKLFESLKSIKQSGKSKSVYVEIDFDIPVTFGAYSYITDSINFLGHKNIFQNIPKEWLMPDFDFLKKEDPDVIIYEPKMFRDEREEDLLEKFRKRNLMDLRAIKERRFYITPRPYDFLAHHGPSFILEAIPWLQRILNE